MIEDSGIDPEIQTFDLPLAKESVKLRSVGFEVNTDTNLRELKKILEEKKKATGQGLVNLEVDNSLKWVLFNMVSGQITSDALWKQGDLF